jgi:hypothetical protein
LIKNDYTIPFLNDDGMKQKLDRVIALKQPNVEKGILKSCVSKLSQNASFISNSPYKDETVKNRMFNTNNNSRLNNTSYFTTRVEDMEEEDEFNSSLILQVTSKRDAKNFTALEPIMIQKHEEDLTRSLIQDSSFDKVFMPPVSLMQRKYNNQGQREKPMIFEPSNFNLKNAEKELSFPMNPAFINDPKFSKLPPLDDLITYC